MDSKPHETELNVFIRSKPSALYNSKKALNNYDVRCHNRKVVLSIVNRVNNRKNGTVTLDPYLFISFRTHIRKKEIKNETQILLELFDFIN